jgi:phosphate starvation-inducible PhoH-like protein
MAVKALKEKQVKRIILTRPAVGGWENLGFLPGDKEKTRSPCNHFILRDMLPRKVEDYILKGIIQIAPLAFMRGRTLDNAFVILMKPRILPFSNEMFLTRKEKVPSLW